MNRTYKTISLVCLAVAVIGLSTLSCSNGHSPGKIHAYSGIDTSLSFRPDLDASTVAECDFDARLNEEDQLTIFRVDCETREILDGKAPATAETLADTLTEQLKPLPRSPGTFPERYFAEVARRSSSDREPFVVTYRTDGDVDNWSPSTLAALRSAARQLAANHCIAIVFIGVHNDKRHDLRAAFEPIKNEQILMYGTEDVDVDALLARINQARR